MNDNLNDQIIIDNKSTYSNQLKSTLDFRVNHLNVLEFD